MEKLKELNFISLEPFETKSGSVQNIKLSYQLFGKPLGEAPIVMINHALTGNSKVAEEQGWWGDVVAKGKTIDTNKFTVLAFNIPGNGYDDFFVNNPENFQTQDIASLFLLGLEKLGINQIDYLIGGSLGGSIAWEMLNLKPSLAKNFISVASGHKTSDWLFSQCLVQKYLLEHQENPLQKARAHAMLCYRTPESINERFQNEVDEEKNILKSHDWLNYHGEALNKRFSIQAYRFMNRLLMTVNTPKENFKNTTAAIHQVAIDSDLCFTKKEIQEMHEFLSTEKDNVFYHEIKSIHGHDAFLMEYEQLTQILKKIIS